MIWMFIFMALPLLGSAYLSWHLWTLLPLPAFWRCVLIVLLVGSFLLLFLNFGRRFDALPMPLATACYEVSTSSIFIMMYMVLVFLALDLGRLVRLVPHTGRMHQLRVHMAAIGCPLVGDWLYGTESDKIARAALHSERLVFRHPLTGETIDLTAPVPRDMAKLVE